MRGWSGRREREKKEDWEGIGGGQMRDGRQRRGGLGE